VAKRALSSAGAARPLSGHRQLGNGRHSCGQRFCVRRSSAQQFRLARLSKVADILDNQSFVPIWRPTTGLVQLLDSPPRHSRRSDSTALRRLTKPRRNHLNHPAPGCMYCKVLYIETCAGRTMPLAAFGLASCHGDSCDTSPAARGVTPTRRCRCAPASPQPFISCRHPARSAVGSVSHCGAPHFFALFLFPLFPLPSIASSHIPLLVPRQIGPWPWGLRSRVAVLHSPDAKTPPSHPPLVHDHSVVDVCLCRSPDIYLISVRFC
jgi:hypothetical protein